MTIDHDKHGGKHDKHGNTEPKQSRAQRAKSALKEATSGIARQGGLVAKGIGKGAKRGGLAMKIVQQPAKYAGKIHNVRNRLTIIHRILSKKGNDPGGAKHEVDAARTALKLKF